jgi:hypothetical protein
MGTDGGSVFGDARAPGDARTDAAPTYTPCYTDPLWWDPCLCIGYDVRYDGSAQAGLCVPDESRDLYGVGRDVCLYDQTVTLCLHSERGRSCAPCVPIDYCLALRRHAADRTERYEVVCLYSDGTRVDSGIVPPASCPAGSEGLLCGPGCAPCRGPDACFGWSESNPLGACIEHRDPDTAMEACEPARPCSRGNACLRPTNLSEDGGAAPGFCVPLARCQAVASAAPTRFHCTP